MESKEQKRVELKAKLKQMMNDRKIQEFQMPKKEQRKLEKEIKADQKLIETDPRVTKIMRDWFIEAMKSSSKISDIKSPPYILNNMEAEKLKFYNFLTKYMKTIEKEIADWKAHMTKAMMKLELQSERDAFSKELEDESKKKFKRRNVQEYAQSFFPN
jgi:hypothetical protein